MGRELAPVATYLHCSADFGALFRGEVHRHSGDCDLRDIFAGLKDNVAAAIIRTPFVSLGKVLQGRKLLK